MFYVSTPNNDFEEFDSIEKVIGFIEKDLDEYREVGDFYSIDDYAVIEGEEVEFTEIPVKTKIVRKESFLHDRVLTGSK